MRQISKTCLSVISVFLMVVVLSACGLVGNRELSLSLKESKVNEIIQSAEASNTSPFRVTNVDMQDGFIRVALTYQQPGGVDLNGSYDVSFSLDKAQLSSKITRVDMPGLTLDQKSLDQIARLITQDFVIAGARLPKPAEIVSVDVNDDEMLMVVRIQP
jgi:hypothetical protein